MKFSKIKVKLTFNTVVEDQGPKTAEVKRGDFSNGVFLSKTDLKKTRFRKD